MHLFPAHTKRWAGQLLALHLACTTTRFSVPHVHVSPPPSLLPQSPALPFASVPQVSHTFKRTHNRITAADLCPPTHLHVPFTQVKQHTTSPLHLQVQGGHRAAAQLPPVHPPTPPPHTPAKQRASILPHPLTSLPAQARGGHRAAAPPRCCGVPLAGRAAAPAGPLARHRHAAGESPSSRTRSADERGVEAAGTGVEPHLTKWGRGGVVGGERKRCRGGWHRCGGTLKR
eukprot:358893-Chlamydomonas_euryale.AAC.2